jgi:hypothetical protein
MMRAWLVAAVVSGVGAANAPAQDVFVSPVAVHDFGVVFIGTVSPGFTVTIENRGAAAHVIDEIRLGDTAAFLLDTASGAAACGDVPVVLEAGASCAVDVLFAPDAQSAFTGTLFVHSDDPAAATLAATVVGEGQLHPDPTIVVEPLTVDFSTVRVGDRKGPLIMHIENLGALDLELAAMSLDNQRLFELNVVTAGDQPCGTTTPSLAALEGCTIGLRFSPEAEGPAETVLHLHSNDPATSEVRVTLTGTGLPESSGGGGGGGGCFMETLGGVPLVVP